MTPDQTSPRSAPQTLSLITCGGTIAMQTGPDGIRIPADADTLVELVSHMVDLPVSVTRTDQGDSSQATPTDWTATAHAVAGQSRRYNPVIVTHGTDTLAWAAGALATQDYPAPVVLTAANIPLGESGSDASTNLSAALAVATQAQPGVYVVFAGAPDTQAQVFQGGYVRKLKDSAQAFIGLPGPLGMVRDGRYVSTAAARITPRATNSQFSNHVTLIQVTPVLDLDLYYGAIGTDHTPAAVVIELYPCSTAPSSLADLVATYTALGIPVLACPPCPAQDSAAHYPSTHELTAAGATFYPRYTAELLVPFAATLR